MQNKSQHGADQRCDSVHKCAVLQALARPAAGRAAKLYARADDAFRRRHLTTRFCDAQLQDRLVGVFLFFLLLLPAVGFITVKAMDSHEQRKLTWCVLFAHKHTLSTLDGDAYAVSPQTQTKHCSHQVLCLMIFPAMSLRSYGGGAGQGPDL